MTRKVQEVKNARSLVPRKAAVPNRSLLVLPGSIGGGVKCADVKNWLSSWEKVPRILIGVTARVRCHSLVS